MIHPVAKPIASPSARSSPPIEVMSASRPDGLVLRVALRLPDVADIRRLTGDSGFFTDSEVDVAEELAIDLLEKGPDSAYRFLVAELAGGGSRGGGVIGYASFGPISCTLGSFDLYWIVVDNDHQGLGLGRQLMQESERLAVTEGARRMYVETSSKPQYLPTRAFYERCGYHVEAQLHDFYAPGDGKVIYMKALCA